MRSYSITMEEVPIMLIIVMKIKEVLNVKKMGIRKK